MKIAEVEKRVNSFIDSLNKELSINASANVVTSTWQKHGKDRTYIKIEMKVGDKTLLFDAGFINNQTHRYNKDYLYANKKYYTDAVNFGDEDDATAFAVVYKRLANELGIKKEVPINIFSVNGENYEFPAGVEPADNKIYIAPSRDGDRKYVIVKKADDVDYMYTLFRLRDNGRAVIAHDWDYTYEDAIEDLEIHTNVKVTIGSGLEKLKFSGKTESAVINVVKKSPIVADAAEKKPAKEKPAVHPMMSLTLEEMRHDAERVIMQKEFLNRTPDSVRAQKVALIEYAEELLSRKAKKAEFCKMFDMRAAVSRAENAARNK